MDDYERSISWALKFTSFDTLLQLPHCFKWFNENEYTFSEVVKKMDSECVKTNVGAVQHPTMLTAVFIAVLLAMRQYWYHFDCRGYQLLCVGLSWTIQWNLQFGQQLDTLNCTWVTANNMATAVASDSSAHLVNVIELNMPHNFLSFMYKVGKMSPWPITS